MHSEAVDQAGPVAAQAADWTPPSWEDVVRDHSARVYRLAYRLTGNSHDAEDLTQEVFVRVFRSLPTYTPGTFEGWLHRITTNLFLDITRPQQRIRFDGLADDAAARLRGAEPTPIAGVRRPPSRRRHRGGARGAAPRVPGRRRPVRHRGTDLRGDRGRTRRQARHRPQPDSPRPRPAADRPGASQAEAAGGPSGGPGRAGSIGQPDGPGGTSASPAGRCCTR